MGLVYGIKHRVSGKIYVGSSTQPKIRKRQHFSDLRCNRHKNQYLQRAFNKYGESAFEWIVLEEAVDLEIREEFWIKELRANNRKFGYNGTDQPYAPMRGKRHSKKTIERLCNSSHKGENHPISKYTEADIRQVFTLSKNGCTGKEIERQMGIDQTNVSLILRGRAWKHLGLVDIKHPKISKSGKCGVYKTPNGKWMAEITINKKRIYLGTHESFEKAAKARDEAERTHYGI